MTNFEIEKKLNKTSWLIMAGYVSFWIPLLAGITFGNYVTYDYWWAFVTPSIIGWLSMFFVIYRKSEINTWIKENQRVAFNSPKFSYYFLIYWQILVFFIPAFYINVMLLKQRVKEKIFMKDPKYKVAKDKALKEKINRDSRILFGGEQFGADAIKKILINELRIRIINTVSSFIVAAVYLGIVFGIDIDNARIIAPLAASFILYYYSIMFFSAWRMGKLRQVILYYKDLKMKLTEEEALYLDSIIKLVWRNYLIGTAQAGNAVSFSALGLNDNFHKGLFLVNSGLMGIAKFSYNVKTYRTLVINFKQDGLDYSKNKFVSYKKFFPFFASLLSMAALLVTPFIIYGTDFDNVWDIVWVVIVCIVLITGFSIFFWFSNNDKAIAISSGAVSTLILSLLPILIIFAF